MMKKKFIFRDLTIQDTTLYKGLAILMIVAHNFFHFLPPKIGENEQGFNPVFVERFLETFFSAPEYIFQSIFSFLGHYGVQVFIFLSAYGLTKKYLIENKIMYFDFLTKRMIKIYLPFIFTIIVWLLYNGLLGGGIPHMIDIIIENQDSLIYKLTLVANFIPGELYRLNGPWWFVSLIIQFYIIFPFMMSLFKKYGDIFLLIISIISLGLTAYLQPHVNFPLPGTILTHIPELSFGIFLASRKKFEINYFWIILIIIIFLLSNFYNFFWYFSFMSALVLCLMIFQFTSLKLTYQLRAFIMFIGSISMYIFYVNGFLRTPWYVNAIHYNSWYINIFIFILFLMLVLVVSYLMMEIDRKFNFEKKIKSFFKVAPVLLVILLVYFHLNPFEKQMLTVNEDDYTLTKHNIDNNHAAQLKPENGGNFFIHPGVFKPTIGTFVFKEDTKVELNFSIKKSEGVGEIEFTLLSNNKEIENFVLTAQENKAFLININAGDEVKIITDKFGSADYDWGNLNIKINKLSNKKIYLKPFLWIVLFILLFIHKDTYYIGMLKRFRLKK